MNHTQFTQWRQGRYTMGRVFEDGSLVRHAQLRFEAACQSAVAREFELVLALADVAAEPLDDQNLEVRFVVDDENLR